jgi:dihydropteroate synthase
VARAVCAEGDDVINDAWGGYDPGLVDVAAEYDAGIVCTHTGGVAPRTRPHRVDYEDVVADVIADTTAYAAHAVGERLNVALAATALCALARARIYRVHGVVETRQVVDMVSSVAGRRPPARPIRALG